MIETEHALLALVVNSHNRWMDAEVAEIRATNAALLARLPQGFQPVLPPRAPAKRTTCLDCGKALSGRGAPQRCKRCEGQRRRALAAASPSSLEITRLRAKVRLWQDRCRRQRVELAAARREGAAAR